MIHINILIQLKNVQTEAMKKVNASPGEIAAIGITNQRETTILWDKETGKPVSNAYLLAVQKISSNM